MTYQAEFPDFPAADMPTMPEGFVDESWHNDVCPCFRNEALELVIWVDYTDITKREFQDGTRFMLARFNDEILATSDEWADILVAITERSST